MIVYDLANQKRQRNSRQKHRHKKTGLVEGVSEEYGPGEGEVSEDHLPTGKKSSCLLSFQVCSSVLHKLLTLNACTRVIELSWCVYLSVFVCICYIDYAASSNSISAITMSR